MRIDEPGVGESSRSPDGRVAVRCEPDRRARVGKRSQAQLCVFQPVAVAGGCDSFAFEEPAHDVELLFEYPHAARGEAECHVLLVSIAEASAENESSSAD